MRLVDADELMKQFPVGGGVTAARARRAIEKAETVNSVSRGRWMKIPRIEHLMQCSVCGCPSSPTLYCKGCGARMEG